LPNTIEGFDYLQAIAQSERGAVVVLPHVGDWETGGAWMSKSGLSITTVAEVLEPPELFEWFCRRREAVGLHVLPLQPSTVRDLLSALRDGKIVALLADRDINGDGVEVDFFGEKTTVPGGPALLAIRAKVPVIPCTAFQNAEGGVNLVVRPPIEFTRTGKLSDDMQRLSQAITDELEALIRLAPEQWHLFQPNWPSVTAGKS
jgi:KDO2-lipid IV(A) lauroyltransferase